MNTKVVLTVVAALTVVGLYGDIKVSDVEVFSGYPWEEVVVGYTITGTDANADAIRLTATDKVANMSYTAKELTGAKFTEGRHVLLWNAAAQGVKFSSSNVIFAVSVCRGVQLWEGGPYWARCNVGAEKPEDYGYYFWWGDTVGYKRNANNDGWVSVANGAAFSFDSDNCPTYVKDNTTLKSSGYIDSTGNLVAKYDAATAHLGAPWRMPTDAEMSALISNCTTTWTKRNGVYGRLVTGTGAYASKSIFLPAAGDGGGSGLGYAGSYGFYWSSTPSSDYSDRAWYLYFFRSSYFIRNYHNRCNGQSVRPVRGFAK